MPVSGKSDLSISQHLAIEHITQYARNRKYEAQESIKGILQMSNISSGTFEDAVLKLKSNARVALHFHPDRPVAEMKSVAQALLEQGIYKSQFET